MKKMSCCVALMMAVVLLLPIFGLGEDAKTRFKIDSHYHYRNEPDFIRKTVEVYGKYNTMVCVLTPMQAIEVVRDAMKKYPETIIGYGSIKLDDPNALEQIDKFHQAGFKGIGEMSNPARDYNDAAYFPIYERIQRYGMHAVSHGCCGPPKSRCSGRHGHGQNAPRLPGRGCQAVSKAHRPGSSPRESLV